MSYTPILKNRKNQKIDINNSKDTSIEAEQNYNRIFFKQAPISPIEMSNFSKIENDNTKGFLSL